MKVLLLYKSGRPGAGDYFARMMPVGLGWINATLRQAGFESSLANLSRSTWSAIETLVRRERPDLVGITLYTFNRHPGLKLAALVKKINPGCVVIVGGPHATHVGGSILRRTLLVQLIVGRLLHCLAQAVDEGLAIERLREEARCPGRQRSRAASLLGEGRDENDRYVPASGDKVALQVNPA